jgi:hypothetical protein
MSDQIDINVILDSLKERIGQLEVDKAILTAQLKQTPAAPVQESDPFDDEPLPEPQPELLTERSN